MSKKYTLYLNQHIGVPAEPIVHVGDLVKRGQKIAVPSKLGANIHASVSGKIVKITEDYIVIDADDEQPEDYVPIKETENILETVKEAGIVGMGGAGFPTHVKLDIDLKGGYVIANAAECEPILSHNIKQIEENPEKIYRGLKYVMQTVNASKGYIGIKAKNKKAIDALMQVIDDDNIQIKKLPDMYPEGEERALVKSILGKLLKPNELPSAADAVVCNVETIVSICEAVEERKPLISKNITVAGRLKSGRDAHVFEDVPLGTPVSELIEKAGGIDSEYGEILIGGPFTGKPGDLNTPVVKTTGGVLVTIPFPKDTRKMGLLECGCGADEARLRQIAEKMGAEVVAVDRCKRVQDVKNGIKCDDPGNCPGQAQKVMNLKKQGAEAIIVGCCSDCTNTVMGIAPKLKLPVYHHTDHVMRTAGKYIVRRLKV